MNVWTWLRNNWKDILFFGGLAGAVYIIYESGMNNPISTIATTWRSIMIFMILFVLLASWLNTNNLLFGWLINKQNRMSLSRLQMFFWTVVILSAFVTAVLANLQLEQYETAVSIAIPEELWLAMGIATTSLAGTSLILEYKSQKSLESTSQNNDLVRRITSQNKEIVGVLVAPKKPSLRDLISGEEVGNEHIIDLTRLQNLLFTFVLVGSYMASLNAMFTEVAAQASELLSVAENLPISQFPELGSSAIALLTISHAGYLAVKAIDKQPSNTP